MSDTPVTDTPRRRRYKKRKQIPNLLSLSRVLFTFLCTLLLYVEQIPYRRTWAFVAYIIASLTDWWDGAVARKYGWTSPFGTYMDAIADKVLQIGIFIDFLLFGILPRS
ncbi:CDP-alcohol phosphatidyltransferase [Kipferlia bialata]|uniref:CDP-alcohol phosphatidyltransferase n=1 Tax=Kipferlia bialata TaxID=797122 RepID=A0A9K3D9D3_9EUKA|nr:CDP-alcohol phosphatidyltransferase [Kipferlia bialata]|eukprot:g12216.t1